MSGTLISKLQIYLFRLQVVYENARERQLCDIILNCRYALIEDVSYDSWNGGVSGHDVVLFLPIHILTPIALEEIKIIQDRLLGDLAKLAQSIEREYFHGLWIELNDENDIRYQRATAFSKRVTTSPDAVEFWRPGLARVFISHRDAHKAEARALGDALEDYGMSCFVAHDTIRPMSEWRNEIMKGLETMEAMVIFLTDDFDDSKWCQQEVGFALGRNTPIIPLKLGSKDPPGFVSHVQALRGAKGNLSASAKGLFPLIGKALGAQERLNEVLIKSFCDSPSYTDAKARFDRMSETVVTLTDPQVQQIIDAFSVNNQLYGAGHLTSKFQRLRCFLERATGRRFVVANRTVKEIEPQSYSDQFKDLPF